MYSIFKDPKIEAINQLVSVLFEQKTELLVEDSSIIKHLEHLEDLVLTSKDRFVKTIQSLLKIAVQHEGADDTLVVEKIDGAPALFILNDPRTNTVGVSTKSIGGKSQKIAHSKKEVAELFESEGLQVKLNSALLHLGGLDFGHYAFQGDVLFTKEDIAKQRIKGKDYLTFTPNVLMYAVAIDANSDLYQKISTSDFGIVIHTIYKVHENAGQLELNRTWAPKEILNLIEQGSKVDGLFITHPFHPQIKLDVSEEDIAQVNNMLVELEKIEYKNIDVKTKEYFDRYINAEIKKTGVSLEPRELLNKFISFLDEELAKETAKLKTEKGKEGISAKFDKIKREVKTPQFINLLTAYSLALKIKRVFLDVFSHISSKIGGTFFKQGQEITQTGPEGFVLSVDDGIVKLVDRNIFSKSNFLFGTFNKKD